MKTAALIAEIRKKNSFLCVGLDTDKAKIPSFLLEKEDPIFEFNKAIIEATHKYAVAYKPNIAFYEAEGIEGWKSLEKTMNYLNTHFPEIFTIADAKRGDIGNTSDRYAKTFFDTFAFDSVTVAPYMGKDSVEPFLEYQDKHTILLALTSNPGAEDFQTKRVEEKSVFQIVLETSKTWKNSENLMYVIGATQASALADIRQIIPNAFLLVPGVGAQGGSLAEVCKYGMNRDIGLLVNSSRGIIYASQKEDFAKAAEEEAARLQNEMKSILNGL
ncbi:MAG: orotidine-5'-phosphate decarboxylase [Bacteroidetes bacterium]|nr:orotidine-5'-phosphate decarboxylase [Bacteroidota bacterium]